VEKKTVENPMSLRCIEYQRKSRMIVKSESITKGPSDHSWWLMQIHLAKFAKGTTASLRIQNHSLILIFLDNLEKTNNSTQFLLHDSGPYNDRIIKFSTHDNLDIWVIMVIVLLMVRFKHRL